MGQSKENSYLRSSIAKCSPKNQGKRNSNSPQEVKWVRYGEAGHHQWQCSLFSGMETLETFFLDGFPFDEISRSYIDGDGHISAASPTPIFTRTLLTVVSKIIKRLSYYCKHIWWPELLYTFSAAYDMGCLQTEGPKILRPPLQSGALSDLSLGRPASHVRNGDCKSHWTQIKQKGFA